MDLTLNERIAILETKVSAVDDRLNAVQCAVNNTSGQVQAIHNAILTTDGQARGIFKTLAFLGAILVGFATILVALKSWLPKFP